MTLSGGNQQKVLFGRTLAREPKVLVLCEPTAGVDIGARHAIYDFVAEQVRLGLSVIVASSDVGDLLALCTRVLVLQRRRGRPRAAGGGSHRAPTRTRHGRTGERGTVSQPPRPLPRRLADRRASR